MKVENVKTNYVGNRYASKKPAQNFTASPTGVVRSVEEILEEVIPNQKSLNFINKFEKLRGELGGILITAVGTGLVAPFSIAFNPFVKAKPGATEEEKKDLSNTKKYTAMRQPISAVLAAFFQAGALGPIDRFLDKMSNDPEYSKNFWIVLDQSSVQKKEYLQRVIKEEMKKDPLTAVLSKDEFKAELDARVRKRQSQQIDKIADVLGETSQIRIGKNGERVLPDSEVASYINAQIKNYIADTQALKYNSEGLAFYVDRAATLMENKDLLHSILSEEKMAEYKGKPRDLKNYLLSLRDKPENISVHKILSEIIETPDQIRESRCFRTLDRIKRIESACAEGFDRDKYLKKLIERNSILDMKLENLESLKIKDVDKATTETIRTTIEKLIATCGYDARSSTSRDIFENTDVYQNDLAKLGKKIRKDIAKCYKETLEHRYKGFSQISKVAIGVFITLPITCTALNWVYPRFMDLVFPSLAGRKTETSKVKNGGDK